MAEGDSIHRQGRRLHAQLSGALVSSCDFRVPRLAVSDLRSQTLDAVVPVGKHLLMRFVGLKGAWTLHSAPHMSGRWALLDSGSAMASSQRDQVRAVISFATGQRLLAIDMPVLELLPTADERLAVGHLGPDLCADHFDMEEAIRRFTADGERSIIEALLDQRNSCGVGNLWAVELCFLRGLFPWTPTKAVNVEAALRLARKMMRYSLLQEPGMITTGSKRRGETHWVYGRYNQPCRRCRAPIVFRSGGASHWDRETWWCPHCQPADRAVPPPVYRAPDNSGPQLRPRSTSCRGNG